MCECQFNKTRLPHQIQHVTFHQLLFGSFLALTFKIGSQSISEPLLTLIFTLLSHSEPEPDEEEAKRKGQKTRQPFCFCTDRSPRSFAVTTNTDTEDGVVQRKTSHRQSTASYHGNSTGP